MIYPPECLTGDWLNSCIIVRVQPMYVTYSTSNSSATSSLHKQPNSWQGPLFVTVIGDKLRIEFKFRRTAQSISSLAYILWQVGRAWHLFFLTGPRNSKQPVEAVRPQQHSQLGIVASANHRTASSRKLYSKWMCAHLRLRVGVLYVSPFLVSGLPISRRLVLPSFKYGSRAALRTRSLMKLRGPEKKLKLRRCQIMSL